jgi:polyphosphate kinase 2 (PPK2 family)
MIEKLINQLHKNLAKIANKKIAFVLEGRDASGKGGFVKLLINYDVPFIYRHQGMPTQTRMKKWLSDYEKIMPKKGELVIYDRSWHTRSWVHPVYNYCTARQYLNHIHRVKKWELAQEKKGIIIIKNWISLDRNRQEEILELRKINKPYKYSKTDALATKYFNDITDAKEKMFLACPSWNVIEKDKSKIELLKILIKATG